ncbi:PQQ-dependent sugar dehydrogenase [Amnibacterium flavum]|uniref:Glucose dehydrogenase n=1 Tax=Amnibacterium flavum TaxID=2173173 RepID=A0A2V1HX40_9MICO|nr:glucose dehydrogenase [Amnibacterium flavum]
MKKVLPLLALTAVAVALVGCTEAPERTASPRPVPTASASTEPTAPLIGAVAPVGEATALAAGLQAPWSVVPVQSGSALVSERDTASVVELTADGQARVAGVVEGVVPGGEGGLLGLAVLPEDSGATWLYAYFTGADDNRIVRMPLEGGAGTFALGAPEVILEGIAKARNHDGGRLAFGPDGMLYATSGDAGQPGAAQDPLSLNGKILRMTPEGDVPADNPIEGSLTWSYGHRNPQGIAWTESGAMYAAEFGQDTWDEINRIEPGSNYGWPEAEGIVGDSSFVDPIVQWSTDEASPSGLAAVGSSLFVAGLGGERLWIVQGADSGSPTTDAAFGELGRIRDVIAAPDGTLWMLTGNTDGRGDPREGDDRLVSVPLTSAG